MAISNRILRGETDIQCDHDYATLEERINYLLLEDNDTLGERLLGLANDKTFKKQFLVGRRYEDNFQKQMDALCNDYPYENPYDSTNNLNDDYERYLDKLNYLNNQVIGKGKKGKFLEKLICKNRVKGTRKSKIREFLSKINVKTDVELLRFLKTDFRNHSYFIQGKNKYGKFVKFLQTSKVFYPLLINAIIFFTLLIPTGLLAASTASAIICIVLCALSYFSFFSMGIFFIHKLLKLDHMRNLYQNFRHTQKINM
ncbi:hypothetical protein POVWA2_086030 [Plasmodium ovale wallikeri]|uniref:Pv-fam-d protein n=1 Tax=Plasmodium ovale wallikeri TaxID=864142 RepID=A0A1A9AR91_PLAOA|nr:hypothetical protein POVWA1_072880 [Plasmodium ovale wallikeri]SBT58644.1 hypothetical protein POVWA2_086030 [Plasmodium ovale wallikeri]